MIKYIYELCGVDDQSILGKVGYFTSFLASGTDCPCCLGWRILLAFIIGVALGLCAVVYPVVALGLSIGAGGMLAIAFTVYRLIKYEESLQDEDDDD